MSYVARCLVSLSLAIVFVSSLGAVQVPAAEKKDEKKDEKAAAPAVPGKAPKIQFAEQSHDFGEIMQNSALKHTFTFKNIGEDVLKIENVKAG